MPGGCMLLTLFSAIFLILLIRNPALCTLGAAKGLSLWYEQVLPALFPAMAAASFLISRKSIQTALKRLPLPAAAAFLSGFLCGSPMGALTCSGLYASGLLSQQAARWIVCFVQLPSPLFLSGFVASASLALPAKMRFVFLLCAYLPFCTSFLLCILLFLLQNSNQLKKTKATPDKLKRNKRSILEGSATGSCVFIGKGASKTAHSEPSLNDICDTCLLLLVRIGVLLMFFSILSEFLTSIASQSVTQLLLIGMLEMTTGISKIGAFSALSLSLQYKAAACLFLLGFGGICVHIQVRQAWQQSDFPIFRYLLVRLLFGLCSSLCFLFLV